jgi:hypothetical protein
VPQVEKLYAFIVVEDDVVVVDPQGNRSGGALVITG